MSSPNFKITTHTFPGQHIREYPGATRHREEDIQHLEAKQYTPLSNPNPQDGDITIILCGGASFPKEMYEPFWDEFLTYCTSHNIRIRSIWCADKSEHGASGVLNEHTQGDDPSHFDFARDLLHMTNVFRSEMIQPIVGIAHSMGSTSLLELHRIHPRLFSSLILIDPALGAGAYIMGYPLVHFSSQRRDLWSSREEAEKSFRNSKAWKHWDPRVMDLFLKHGLRDTPTLLYPEPGKVTLRTTKAQEVWSYTRPWFDPLPGDGTFLSDRSRAKYPDGRELILDIYPLYKPELVYTWDDLPGVRCSLLFVFPSTSPMCTPEMIEAKMKRTGVGPGGNGGEESGRTSKVVLKGAGHLVPFEQPGYCARAVVEWLGKDLEAWKERREFERANRDDKGVNQLALSEEWMRREKAWFDAWLAKMKGKARL